jgi:hypothetical protein
MIHGRLAVPSGERSMPASAPSLQRQVARVRRRLFLQTLVQTLIRCWVGALLVAVVWFLAEPFVFRDAVPNLRWYVLGIVVGLATMLAVALAAWWQPSALAAALSLDERFQLKERVTTSLTLDPRDLQLPAALALLADVDRRVAPLYISDRFPIRIPWTAALVPVFAVALLLLAFFYKPNLNQAQTVNSEEEAKKVIDAEEAQKKLEQVAKKVENRKVADKPQSQAMQNIDKELDQLAHKPLKTNDDVHDAQKDITKVEDLMKKRDKDLADRQESLKEQMKQVERLTKKENDEKKDGPADKMDNDINKGNFDKAQDEAQRLSKKLQQQEQAKKDEEKAKEDVERLKKKEKEQGLSDDEKKEKEQAEERLAKAKKDQLTPEEEKNLEQQLQDEQDKLERLTRDREEKLEELQGMKDEGEIDQEQLDREKDQLAKEQEDEKNLSDDEKKEREQEKKDLQELAQKLGECKKCMKDGDNKGAGEKLDDAAKLMRKLDNKGEQKDLQQKLKQLQEAKKELAKANGDGKGNGRDDSGRPNRGGRGAGQRPQGEDDGKTGHEEVQSRSAQDKGEHNVIDYVPGQGFKGPRKPSDMKDDIRRASQDAPEAIDRQRLPRSASDMARGYFDKMRGPEKTPEK